MIDRKTLVGAIVVIALLFYYIKQHTGEATVEPVNTTQTIHQTEEPEAETGFELPAITAEQQANILQHVGHTLLYNKEHNTPDWVAWMLTAERLEGNVTRSNAFAADKMLPKAYRVDNYDYKGSGYDRGHMCPSGDMKWSEESMRDCFLMSNMCPQLGSLNSGAWNALESACRNWARTEGCIYIVCGPVWDKQQQHEQIGLQHKVDVPEAFFKVVLSLSKGHEKAIGFYYRNEACKQSIKTQATTVDEIEAMTGFDFFCALDDAIENRIEAKANLRDWQ